LGLIFETERLQIRLAVPQDAGLVHRLWTDGRVMTFVGFPHGLRVTLDEVEADIRSRGEDIFRQLLVVELRSDQQSIGHCQFGEVDEDGIVEPDVKLLPEFWGCGYGREVFQGLVNYLFDHTHCSAVQTTPNRVNTASCKMVEAAGGVLIGEGSWEPPQAMRSFAVPISFYTYRVFRK
jgi:ribosomal-protein-alanine N-acetyltransferase